MRDPRMCDRDSKRIQTLHRYFDLCITSGHEKTMLRVPVAGLGGDYAKNCCHSKKR